MIARTLAQLAAACDGSLHGVPDASVTVTGPVVIDSRAVGNGALFVALPGEHLDGHDFASVAVHAGAVAVLASRPVGVPAVVVEDVTVALGQIARAVLDQLPQLAVVAVTGSSGKTGTKDLLAHLLSALGPTVAPPGSFNNEIGLPLTALRADRQTRHLVLEMGARGPGHIAYLASLARPRTGVVLNVGSAHLGEFGSRAAVAAAKGELVEALPSASAGGVAVLNADDPLVLAMAARTPARVVTYGRSPVADVRGIDETVDANGRWGFTLLTGTGSAPVQLRLVGAHQVSNALAAAAVAIETGLPVDRVARDLGTAVAASPWRMEVTETPGGITVVNDAYNANPESVRAALETLVQLGQLGQPGQPGHRRRTWAVLGEMRELGDRSASEHAGIGRFALGLGVDCLLVVGEAARPIAEVAGASVARVVGDKAEAVDVLRAELRRGDVVLVKASRAAGLETVAAALAEPRP